MELGSPEFVSGSGPPSPSREGLPLLQLAVFAEYAAIRAGEPQKLETSRGWRLRWEGINPLRPLDSCAFRVVSLSSCALPIIRLKSELSKVEKRTPLLLGSLIVFPKRLPNC